MEQSALSSRGETRCKRQRGSYPPAMRTAILALCLAASPLIASPPPNPFFAMDTIARGGPEQVVPLLKELGYAGLGGQAGDNKMAEAMEAAGLRFFNGYITLSFDSEKPVLDEHLRGVIDRMSGHDATLWIALQKVAKSGAALSRTAPEGDAIALSKLTEIADYAKSHGVPIALYPHTGSWIETVEDALRVANKLNRDDVGVTFNLCHWLKVEGADRDPLPVLKSALPRLRFVTINGADTGDTKAMGWDRLIQPLGSGTYDLAAFMSKLRVAGYKGPIGFQGFGIHQNPRAVLEQTMNAWNHLLPDPQR